MLSLTDPLSQVYLGVFVFLHFISLCQRHIKLSLSSDARSPLRSDEYQSLYNYFSLWVARQHPVRVPSPTMAFWPAS